jgi:hypothetical protein
MKTLALTLLAAVTLEAQTWMSQDLLLGVWEQIDEGVTIEEVYVPLTSSNNDA